MMRIRATIIANVAFVAATLAFSAAGHSVGNPFDTATEQTDRERPYMIAPMRCTSAC